MIKSISFLISESERQHVECVNGKFDLSRRTSISRTKVETRSFTAMAFVQYVKKRDPFITLESGEKMRVFRGGDSTDEVIEAISQVEVHDEKRNGMRMPTYSDFIDWGW